MSATLKTGDKVRLPGGREAFVRWVSPDESWFTTLNDASYRVADAVPVPLAGAVSSP